jgi:hypothetical protein
VTRCESASRTGKAWRGLADPKLDPLITAAALLSTITNMAYWLFVLKDQSVYDVEDTIATVNEVWVRTLDLRRRPNQRWLDNPGPTSGPS